MQGQDCGGQHRRALPGCGDNKINFFIYYEVDGDTSKHHLSASNYGPESEWVLLTHAQ